MVLLLENGGVFRGFGHPPGLPSAFRITSAAVTTTGVRGWCSCGGFAAVAGTHNLPTAFTPTRWRRLRLGMHDRNGLMRDTGKHNCCWLVTVADNPGLDDPGCGEGVLVVDCGSTGECLGGTVGNEGAVLAHFHRVEDLLGGVILGGNEHLVPGAWWFHYPQDVTWGNILFPASKQP